MDRNPQARKRRTGPGQPTTKPPVRLSRDKKDAQKRATKTTLGSETGAVRKTETNSRAGSGIAEIDHQPRSFTVGTVGRNGTLYLKPSRAPPPQLVQLPATPPSTAGNKENGDIKLESTREDGETLGKVTPHGPPTINAHAFNPTLPVPPTPGITSSFGQKRLTRSHSFSTIDDAVKSQQAAALPESAEFQMLLNGQEAGPRRKSSFDLSMGLANFPIPHYRLGTPRFGDRGTAYLHNSMGSMLTAEVRSSVFSRTDMNKFPAPPGRDLSMRFGSRHTSGTPYLHPSQTNSSLASSRAPYYKRKGHSGRIDIALYDHVEANINDPSLVRYSAISGRIMAATPARLVAQITSPWFLDYDLLSNFFLTYRNFISGSLLLEYLLVRLQWALANRADAGRIVTVRTFVALRHWILNYFPDDFLPDFGLRQKFCSSVNDIARALQQRADSGGSDIGVIGELKKCWRRICAIFWPVPDVAESSAIDDILPGEDEDGPRVRASATSWIQSGQFDPKLMDFRRSSIIQLPTHQEESVETGSSTIDASTAIQRTLSVQTATIPATPVSQQSLTVLCCAVPFLRNMLPGREDASTTRSNRQLRERPTSLKSSGPMIRSHQRGPSFSDALRDERPPLGSSQPDPVDVQSLPSTAFTGGLVRGLLLQPSPSRVDLLIPVSPPLDTQLFDFGDLNDTEATPDRDRSAPTSTAGMKKALGDVRRALSHRNTPASSSRSTNSSGSRSSGHSDRADQAASWQQLSGPPRVDLLAEEIEDSYKEAFHEMADLEIAPPLSYHQRASPGMRLDLLQSPTITNRSHSHVTTGSRSIVIVDDTGLPDVPVASGALPPLTPRSRAIAPKPLFGVSPEVPQGFSPNSIPFSGASSTAVASDGHVQHSPEMQMHDLLAVPGAEDLEDGEDYDMVVAARKSSAVQGAMLDMPPIRNQLRRRPGGDLKEADNVQDLERDPRPDTEDSYSTFSQAILSSGEPSVDYSNVHVVDDQGMQIPLSFLQGRSKDSWTLLPTHSSQPNMRPSMKAKVSHLARLPDDINSSGGIEDALAKLEGKEMTPTRAMFAQAERDGEPPLVHYAQPGRFFIQTDSGGIHSPSMYEAISPETDRQGASIYRMSDDTQAVTQRTAAPSELFGLGVSTEALSKFDPTMNPDWPLGPSGIEQHEPEGEHTFLVDEEDDDSLSDISTEIAEDPDVEEDNLGVRSFYFDDTVDDESRHAAPFRPPPTPPSTDGAAASALDERYPVEPKSLRSAIGSPARPLKSNPPIRSPGPQSPSLHHNTAHLPFVLAYESDVIAEQLTIIEKDALDEVDWKDLIGLNWQHSALKLRNWVEFLQRDDCNGIDIVVSRFNLVVKWVVSECLLTEALSERARCITKYIHIAAHAHRLRNYATMYQITLALLSVDLARLHKTWALVAPAEKALLARLERLCQPRGNFQALRVEMETASADDACIPFIGLYTHDLMFNAQKPARIDPSPPGGEPLVNFERYQTAATLVKSLLTLIEASARYVFRPHPEVLSRCLWLAALPDAEIVGRSKTLELGV